MRGGAQDGSQDRRRVMGRVQDVMRRGKPKKVRGQSGEQEDKEGGRHRWRAREASGRRTHEFRGGGRGKEAPRHVAAMTRRREDRQW